MARKRSGDKSHKSGSSGQPVVGGVAPSDGTASGRGVDAHAEERAGAGGKRKRRKRQRPNRAERRAGTSPHVPSSGEMAGDVRTTAPRVEASLPAPDPGEVRNRERHGGRERRRHDCSPAQASPAPPAGERRSGRPDGGCTREGRVADHGSRRLYGALDLGTNNCRLLVARPESRGFRVVDAFSRIVRLGEGLGHTNRLCDAAMDRALEALGCCRDKLEDRGVERFRLIATEACRAAENGPLFIERVREETGLSLEIATRETEARLAVAGCASLVDPDANGVVLFDIGGGSSEIVWLDLRNRCGARGVALTRFIRAWISLPVGVVNLAERHGGRHVCSNIFEAMVADALTHLDDFALGEELSAAICDGKVHMLGTSGTVTTLAGVHFGLKRYDRRRVDGAWMESDDVTAMIERLRAMPYEERVDNPCIGADRADLVLAGCAILEAIRRRWPCQRLRVADRGLREGMLMELMAADNVWRRGGGSRPNRSRGRNER
uniref:Ppx/GppA phosphatase family protein n=1 Tax=Stappia sp. TaxID=1870903 RepID=UPI003BAD7AFA